MDYQKVVEQVCGFCTANVLREIKMDEVQISDTELYSESWDEGLTSEEFLRAVKQMLRKKFDDIHCRTNMQPFDGIH